MPVWFTVGYIVAAVTFIMLFGWWLDHWTKGK